MLHCRTILSFVTAIAVWGNALVCVCASMAGEAGHAVAEAPTHDSHTDHQAGHGDHDHDGGCHCRSLAVTTDANPLQSSFLTADLSAAFFAALPVWRAPAMSLASQPKYGRTDSFGEPPGNGRTLLRQHCALIL